MIGVTTKIFTALVMGLAVMASLGCSQKPNDDVIKGAIQGSDEITRTNFVITEYEILNSYDREIDGETFYFYDYVAQASPVQGSAWKEPKTMSGTVTLVKRGDAWYGI